MTNAVMNACSLRGNIDIILRFITDNDINNAVFADDIDLIAGNTQELQALTDKLSNNASKYGMN